MGALLKRSTLGLLLAAGLALPGAAQDESARRLGDDLFVWGAEVRVALSGLEDVFAGGRTVTVSANVGESAHVMGRQVQVTGGVGRDLYAAGEDVAIRGPVAGDVVAFGDRVELSGSAGADAVLGGRRVEVDGPITGDASLIGEVVEIAAPISGSVEIRAERIRFGPGARVDGTLAYWSPNAVTVPASVASPDRVRGVRVADEDRDDDGGPADRVGGFVVGVLIFLVLGAILAALAPARLAAAHERIVERPGLNLLFGVVALSALFGAIVVLAVSLVGLPLVPLVAIAAPFVCAAGYLTACFSLGRLALGRAKVRPIRGWLGLFTAIAVGVVLLGLVGLVPILGWIVLVLATAVGLGGWFSLLVRPRPAAG